MAEIINKKKWDSVELADSLGMVTNQVSAPKNSAQLLKNLHTHRKPGALRVRTGYALKYEYPSDSSIKNTISDVAISIPAPDNPGVITETSHGLRQGQAITFSTTGALPTGLVAGTIYYVNYLTANTFEVSATYGGTSINTTGTQSGVHSVHYRGFLNYEFFYDRQALATGQEVTCLLEKGTVQPVTGSGVADTQNMLCMWIRPYWNGSAWTDAWQWLNKTIITSLLVGSDGTYPNMVILYLTSTDDDFVGWTIYNKTKSQYAKVITSKFSGGATRIVHTAYDSAWNDSDVVILMKNYVDLTAMAELYSATWDEIQFHHVNNDLRIGFGGKANRPGLMVGYRKNYLMLNQFDFTASHTDLTSAALLAFATTDAVILDTHIANKDLFGIDLTQTSGTLTANTYYFRLTGLLDGYQEQLLAENEITVTGGDDDIKIYPFAYINKLNPRITQLNLYKSTDQTTWYKIKTNPLRTDTFLNTGWKIDEQGRIIIIEAADLITEDNAAKPTSDTNSIGGWSAQDTWGCSFASEDDDIGQINNVTMTIASPCVLTKANHGLAEGQKIRLYTTGALPTGITADTDYYVKWVDASTFKIAATYGGADINTSGTQSGSHYLYCGLRTPQDGSYFLLWENTQFFSMIMKLTSPVITYTTQKVSVSFYAKTNVSGIVLKIGSTAPDPNPFGSGEDDVEYQEVTLSNDGSWHQHTVTMNLYGKLLLQASADALGNTITRIGIDNVVIQSADYLLGNLSNGTEMNSELGYTATYNLVKGWDQALEHNKRIYYLNPYVEKRYENYILVSHIHSSGAYMYDLASFSNFRELEKFDSNKTIGMAVLPTNELLILKDKSVVSIDPDTGAGREPLFGVSCVTLNGIVNIKGLILWPGLFDIYMMNIRSGFNVKGLLRDTILDKYLSSSVIPDKTKIQAIRDKHDSYRIRIYDATNKTEFLLTENGWIQGVKNFFPEVYRTDGNDQLSFMNDGNIYLVDNE